MRLTKNRTPTYAPVRICDTGSAHAVVHIEYEAARAAAFIGYRTIYEREGLPIIKDEGGRIPHYNDPRGHGFLSNVVPSVFRTQNEQRLPELISGADILLLDRIHPDPFTIVRPDGNYRVRACTRFAVEETQRIELFIELAQGTSQQSSMVAFRQMGELMFQSHWSYTDCGLGCAASNLLVDIVRKHCREDLLFAPKSPVEAREAALQCSDRLIEKAHFSTSLTNTQNAVPFSHTFLREAPWEPTTMEFMYYRREHE